MSHRGWFPGMCKHMVSDGASHVVGKRPCERKPVKDDLCAFHQPEKVKARYDALLRKHAGPKNPPQTRWDASPDHKEAAAGALMVLGGMLREWGLPLDRAIRGLREAYRLDAKKRSGS